jgi:hypothetical protein
VKDPNFSRLVDWAKDALKDVSPRHVLLCLEEELEAVRTELASAPWLQTPHLRQGLHRTSTLSSQPRSEPVSIGS